MPFEISPKFVPVKVPGRYKDLADAMRIGIVMTRPAYCVMLRHTFLSRLGITRPEACALGAIFVGAGAEPESLFGNRVVAMEQAYIREYGSAVIEDNDSHRLSREKIADRIEALL